MLSGVLFILMHKIQEPFRCHLLGVIEEQALLPLNLPYKTSMDRTVFSEMSFKCRSSTSLSSHTLVPSSQNSTTTLLPTNSEKVMGLGTYAPKAATASFLAPRPSLSSIRTHTTIGSMPPSSPLPPLPAFVPARYWRGSALHKAVHPPVRPPRPERPRSERTIRIVPSSPALSMANLEAYNKSVESLSSIYSRDVSGEKYSLKACQRPRVLTASSRSYSSGSTATMKKSSLSTMRLASDPDIVVIAEDRPRYSSDSCDTEIDDAATLQAKLPSVKAVSVFGDVHGWGKNPLDDESCQRYSKPPHVESLRIRKTRDSASTFHRKQKHAIV